ncbi:MAG TPA: sigma-70 family RNA polymerase sigma factor [Gemmataceae bacterium]|nr:sigma-70 family RNA polymerase sigma factor [Gemmataceae bacterium]
MTSVQACTVLQHIRRIAAIRPRDQSPDGQLLESFLVRRDEAAFAALVRRHGPMVLGVCRGVLRNHHDAEDAFQATFLVLARKADSIRNRDCVGGWLYGVAYHVAVKAQADNVRRRAQERRAPEMASPDPTLDLTVRDLQRVLHEELAQLPEKYRVPLVLCYLEGLAHEEAARRLGWSKTTFRGRLDRGREHLRRRLTRRGVALSVALGTAGLAQRATPAAAALADAVARAAGAAGSVGVSARVASLAEGACRALFTGKAKLATVVLLAAGLLAAGAGGLAHQVFATPKDTTTLPPAVPQAEARPQPAANGKAKVVEVRGRVLDPDGKPFRGAKVSLVRQKVSGKPLQWQTRSGADGAFRLAIAPHAEQETDYPFPEEEEFLVASADGYGLALSGGAAPSGGVTLRLARDDVPIRGRILDVNGRPIRGVTVRVDSLGVPAGGDLSPWLAALRDNPQDGYGIEERFLQPVSFPDAPSPFPVVTTDADGRFQLRGVGRERVVALTLRGPTIALTQVSVRTRPGKPIKAAAFRYNPGGDRLTYYGATFDHVATPVRVIVGTVRDRDTGKPLAGVTVQSERFAGSNTSGISTVNTVTGQDGRYRLVGMPKGKGNAIKAAPGPEQPYFAAVRDLDNPPGLEPITADFALKRGVLVTGRVFDKVTRQPVRSQALYVVFADNPHHKKVPDFQPDQYLNTQTDGSYQLVAFPGRGIIAARGWNDHYRMSVGADKIKGREPQLGLFLTAPFLLEPNTFNGYVEINPPEGAESLQCDILLDPGRMPRGTVVGPDGKPLAGALALGLTAYENSPGWTNAPLPTAAFTVYGLGDGEARDVYFVHPGKHLAALARVRGDDRGPLTVKLGPWGVVTGRLVGADGKPQAGALLRVVDGPLHRGELQTNQDGGFRLAGLAPGRAYTLDVVRNGQPVGHVFAGLTLKAGETRDLGDVKPPAEKSRE